MELVGFGQWVSSEDICCSEGCEDANLAEGEDYLDCIGGIMLW